MIYTTDFCQFTSMDNRPNSILDFMGVGEGGLIPNRLLHMVGVSLGIELGT